MNPTENSIFSNETSKTLWNCKNNVAESQKSECIFRRIFDNLIDGVILTDLNGIIKEWSRGFEIISGLSRETVLGKPIWEIESSIIFNKEFEGGVEKIVEDIQQVFNEMKDTTFIRQYINNETGIVRILNVRYIFVEMPDEMVMQFIAHDITELIKSWNLTVQNERKIIDDEYQITKLNLAVKASKVGLWDLMIVTSDPVNPNNVFLWTDEFRRMLGYTNEADFPNVLSSWSDKLHPEDKERTIEAFSGHILDKTGKTPYDIEYRLLKKNGEYGHFRASGESVRDKEGNALRVVGALKDITEEKNKILSKEKRFQELGEHIPDGCLFRFVLNRETNKMSMDFMSSTWEAVVGAPVENVKADAMAFLEVIHPDDVEDLGRAFQESIHTLSSFYYETRIINNNNVRWLQISSHPHAEGEQFYWEGVMLDITARKEAEFNLILEKEELIRAKEKAEESDKLKSAFLANISHEIRTPINAITGFLDFVIPDKKSPTSQQYINLINGNCSSLLKLIDDIVDIARIEVGQMELRPVQLNVNNLMYDLKTDFEVYIKNKNKKNIELILDESGFIDNCSIFVDANRFRQILVNLIENAIKFTEKGYVLFGYRQSTRHSPTLPAVETETPKMLEFFVEDTGIGITEEQQIVIFERFRQADLDNTRLYGGVGLGLSISQNLVKLMGGNLWVESTKDVGTTFYFNISV